MIKNGQDILTYCEENNCAIYQMMLDMERVGSNISPDKIKERLRSDLKVMRESVDLEKVLKHSGHLIGGGSQKLKTRMEITEPLCGRQMVKAFAYALKATETNAGMGKIVAAPTAGACGILPAVLFTLEDRLAIGEEELVNGLLTAGAVGIVIGNNACVSGARGGCQSETGSAAAMACAAAIELSGGSPKMALDGAAIAIANVLGLVCDPILGLVESPCNIRNVLGVANALLSADMVLAGMKAVIPFDETVEVMHEVGLSMHHAYRETSLGGLAGTETARSLQKKFIDH